MLASSNGRPANWKESGKPSLPKPQHTVSAGWPVTLNGMVSEGLSRKWKIGWGSWRIFPVRPNGPVITRS